MTPPPPQNYTCPVYYPTSTCTYWDTSTASWSSEGCTYWRTDDVKGIAYCNCTHLTSFASDTTESLQDSGSTFAETLAAAEDLTGKDVLRNIGVFITLLLLWGLAGTVYIYDITRNRFDLMHATLTEATFLVRRKNE